MGNDSRLKNAGLSVVAPAFSDKIEQDFSPITR
jgi:hypothetical protein